MDKKELRRELEAEYLKALCSGELEEDGTLADYFYDVKKIEHLEKQIYGDILSVEKSNRTKPWRNALSSFKKIKESPLAKAMEEKEDV